MTITMEKVGTIIWKSNHHEAVSDEERKEVRDYLKEHLPSLLDKVFPLPDGLQPEFVLWGGKPHIITDFDPVELRPRLVCAHCGVHGLMVVDRYYSDPPLPGKKNRRSRYFCYSCGRTTNKKIWAPTPAFYGDELEVYEVPPFSPHDFDD